MRRRAARVTAAVAAMALLAACGSTVQQTGGDVLAQDPLTVGRDGLGVEPGDSASEGVDPGALAPDGTPLPGGGTGSSGTTTGGAAGQPHGATAQGGAAPAPGAGGQQPRAAGPVGPGVSDDTIRIGFSYVDTGGGTGGVLGQDVSVGNPKEQATAVRDYVNANGGLGGRQMEIVPYGSPYANYLNNAQGEFAKTCSYFTEDQEVLAVGVYVPDENFLRCLAKGDVVSVANGYSLDRKTFSDLNAYYYAPGTMSLDRGAEVGVEGLVAAGALPKDAVIGLLRYNTGTYSRAAASLKRALAAKGRQVETTFEIDYSNTSKATQDAGSAVLRFRQLGVTHVMVLDNSGGIAFAFMQQAQSQRYFPFYGLTTNNSPNALKRLAPAEQLAKATAVSWWWGDVDTNEKQQSPPAVPPTKDLCLKIMRDAGVDLSANAAQGSAIITCDQFLFLKALLDRAPVANSAGMLATADRLGSAYTSTMSYDTVIGPGRHDGATITRIIRWDTGCSCFVYAGPGPRAR